ncbi:YkvA family protein [Metabacillus arenae]|uniref:DUF1232 domain-containing protein n=1 Tax=Metabacillus arenae TaxID=2771434 RepID=A0A926RXP8_9BACI|nr:YkvA family protein [Metabacillus arenae]MBD1380372.1 DUF1232 domain-containing protein [Metabacillus arenae]
MFSNIIKAIEPKAKRFLNSKKKTNSLLKQSEAKGNEKEGELKGSWRTLRTFVEAIKAWKSGEYPHFPKKSVVIIVAALIYFVTPIDLVPDFLIGLGILDDAAVLAFVANQIKKDLNKFDEWKQQQSKTITVDMEEESKK